jgi:hypothetical protein
MRAVVGGALRSFNSLALKPNFKELLLINLHQPALIFPMRSPISTALAFTVLVGLVSPAPLIPRHNGCRPNLANVTASIVNPITNLEWAIINSPTELLGALLVGHPVANGHDSEFKFEGSASSGPYTIKSVCCYLNQGEILTDRFTFKASPGSQHEFVCSAARAHRRYTPSSVLRRCPVSGFSLPQARRYPPLHA